MYRQVARNMAIQPWKGESGQALSWRVDHSSFGTDQVSSLAFVRGCVLWQFCELLIQTTDFLFPSYSSVYLDVVQSP